MAVKYFLVALDNDEKGTLFKNKNNSPIKTLNLWDEFLQTKYVKFDFLKDSEAKACLFLTKFKNFIQSLEDEDTGLFIINTHGSVDKSVVVADEADGYNEIYQLYDQWITDDQIRHCLIKKREKAKFIGIIDTCYASEDFNDINISAFHDNLALKPKNELFFFGSRVVDKFSNAAKGRFNQAGYSYFSFFLLQVLKENTKTTYEEWFKKVKELFNDKSVRQRTQQDPIALYSFDANILNYYVFSNEIKTNQINLSLQINLANYGIFNGVFTKEIDAKMEILHIKTLIAIETKQKNKSLIRINQLNQYLTQLENK